MNERGGQGMDLEGVEVKTVTILSFPRRPVGWRTWGSAERRGARPRHQQRRRRRRWSCMRNEWRWRSDTGRQNQGGRARRSCKSGAAVAESIGERKGGATGGGMDRGGAEEAHRRSSWRPGAVAGPGKRRQRVAAAPSVSQKPKVEDNLWVD